MEIRKAPERHPMADEIKRAKLSQLYLAFRLGISQTLLNSYFRGFRKMPSDIEAGVREILMDQ